ncbi:hypothetical protein [Chryseobacterium geocarposphaerae]|uniref:Uncharacterized protein n=1 Tax=Chryseobacterium geocarposphaerae TaxID=1416776 RepID=A0A2M9C9X9_9FLAO|nr:hypothetical protein [Chryseobacterium geocarposphaerae]PJJ67635.1 hypothetical protein CLV73_1651 [Chryseobacterium geocarposphaerae]
MIKRIAIFLAVLLLNKFQSQSPENSESSFMVILKSQLIAGASGEKNETDYPTYKFTLKDLEATESIISKELKDNGYKKPSTEEFIIRINTVFKRIIDPKSESRYLHINFEDKCSKGFKLFKNSNSIDVNPYSTYVFKNGRFISDLYSIPEIMDYTKNPELFRFEKDAENNNHIKDVKIYYWKDIADLKNIRKQNIKTIVARNMYLFNDNKTYVTWLITQDPTFVKTLVKQFGYTEEPKFNDLIMNDYLNNYQTSSDIGDVIFTKNCNGKLEIRTELLKYIKEHTKSDENRLLTALENFGYALKDNNSFTPDEKYKILAYIGNTVDPFYLNFAGVNSGNAVWNAESVLYNSIVKDRNIISVFQKNNYYDLPDLKDSLMRIQGIIEHSSE